MAKRRSKRIAAKLKEKEKEKSKETFVSGQKRTNDGARDDTKVPEFKKRRVSVPKR